MFSLKDVYLIKFKTHLKGSELLTDYTSKKNIPFNLKRVFLTGNVSKKSNISAVSGHLPRKMLASRGSLNFPVQCH